MRPTRDSLVTRRLCLKHRILLIKVVVLSIFIVSCAVVFSLAITFNIHQLQDLAEQRYGLPGRHAVTQWQQVQNECLNLPIDQKLQIVNQFFNQRILYVDDRLTWKKADYWATPLETLGMGQGDCEDFSFAKYITLHLLGIPVEQLRLTYVKAKILTATGFKNQAHMVLSYYPTPNSQPLILDNLRAEVLPAAKRPDLRPVFSFNTEQLWISGKSKPAGDSSSRLSNWRDVLLRMKSEGISLQESQP